ncbi:MAG: hypothetical protein K0S56_677 [Microvirga sp.]|jgi:hypothetical protein|nr:hypothetical protein [Microvirga sp.]
MKARFHEKDPDGLAAVNPGPFLDNLVEMSKRMSCSLIIVQSSFESFNL